MSHAPALQRGIEILNYLGDKPGATLVELERALDIPKASLTRLVDCLLANDYLCHKPGTKTTPIVATDRVYPEYSVARMHRCKLSFAVPAASDNDHMGPGKFRRNLLRFSRGECRPETTAKN